MTTKAWYKSKVVWLGVITTLLGAVPVLVDLANAYNIPVAAVGTAVIGVLTVVVRVWFTDTVIA